MTRRPSLVTTSSGPTEDSAKNAKSARTVTATGETSGITWNGTATFKDEFVATDPCNFSFSNSGKVPLISRGSSVNTFISFDDLVVMQNCNLTTDQHLVSFDCRGNGKP